MDKLTMRKMLWMGTSLLFLSCTAIRQDEAQPRTGTLSLTTSVVPFDGEDVTKTNLAGNAFATGDRIKLKIICPYSDHTEYGETTYGDTVDAFWLLKWSGSSWTTITSADKVDVAATYAYTSAKSLFGLYEAQQTPYVYTASTWSENVRFISNGSLYSQYSYIFQADQRREADYLKSDLLWAQAYMQTGSYNVHLAFQHVMACLKITVTGGGLSSGAVLTLEGMPDIDQCEVVVGDYYAAQSKVNARFGYKEKTTCSKADNGKVLGVAVNFDTPVSGSARAVVYPFDDSFISHNAVYTAHYDSGVYYLIVPPCTLTSPATFWIRDGEKRYSYQLERLAFEQGKLYPVNITIE